MCYNKWVELRGLLTMILEYFKEISKIPHASFNEEQLSNYIVDFAKERGLRVIQDEMKNVIVFKPASHGYHDHEAVMLQAHLDMVADKNVDSPHDFDYDPLELIEENGWLRANQTTLGADDGVGVAYMLSILNDTKLRHPALECVFTVEEEVTMAGVAALDTSVLNATRMIGLDASGEDHMTVSSSGGSKAEVSYKFKYEKTHKNQIVLKIRGLKGGHSGVEIDKELASAVRIAAGIISILLKEYPVHLSTIDGGLKDNAIMRECDVVLGVNKEIADEVLAKIETIASEYQKMYHHSDPNLRVETEFLTKDCYTISAEATKEIIRLIDLLPYGYFHKSMEIDGLVTSSANIGRIRTLETEILIYCQLRSPEKFMLSETERHIEQLVDLSHAEVEFSDGYPGWNYDADSQLQKIVKQTYKELYHGGTMGIEATHGGLELGYFKEKMPELDIVAIGPVMLDIHTPDERLDLTSFRRVYMLLTRVLEKL